MATNFPTSLDSYTRPQSTDTLATSGVEGYVVADNLYDSVEALEAKVGINSSAVTTSHDYMLRNTGVAAALSYAAGSNTSYTTTSGTFSDVDATNLAITFTAPPSGKVLVRLTGRAHISESGYNIYWGLRESTTEIFKIGARNATGESGVLSVAFVKTGLTPGSSYTYKWAWSTDTSRTGTMYHGPSNGPLIMEVHRVP